MQPSTRRWENTLSRRVQTGTRLPEHVHKEPPEMVFGFKYWAAFILFVSGAVMGGTDLFVYPARIPLVLGLLLGGVFSLTAVEVRAGDDALRYRRFLTWRTIPYAEILDCKLCIWPVYGSLRVTRFVPPWGRIYFVAARSAFAGRPIELVLDINRRRLEPHSR
jgi:hypothetical protein